MRVAVILLLLISTIGLARPDEIRRWRDADGQLSVEITGDGTQVDPDVDGHPLLNTSELTQDEKISIRASIERRRIRRGLEATAHRLAEVRQELEVMGRTEMLGWSSSRGAVGNDPQAQLNAQRETFLAVDRFRRHKEETLARLGRAELKHLRGMQKLWNDFEVIRSEVKEHFGVFPVWWRDEIECEGCLSLTEVEAELILPDEYVEP